MFKKLFRILVKIISAIFLFILLILLPYTITPVYEYPEPTPFAGDQLYNPYAGNSFSHWQRINFHAHSDHWGSIGITNASSNSPDNIRKTYVDELGYTMPGISDYQYINRSLDTMTSYIPVYEHGYNIHRVHQLPVNAKRVTYLDYPLIQKINHKQHVINALRRQSDFVILAHPRLDSGYIAPDLSKLANYQAIEILNTFAYYKPAMEYWDIALSSGRYIVAAGNDDMHNLNKQREFGYRFNSVGTSSKYANDLLTEMKRGNHLVVSTHRSSKDNITKKREKLAGVENRISDFIVAGDTITLTVNYPTHFISFLGDNGEMLKKVSGDTLASYVMKPENTYVRAEVHFRDHTNIYLNPVVRYSGDISVYQPVTTIKYFQTIIFTIIRLAIWLILFSFVLVKVIIRWR